MSRLAGAWVTDSDETCARALEGRLLYTVGGGPPTDKVSRQIKGLIDIPMTLAKINDWIDKWNRIQSESLTPKGEQRAPIPWPLLPQPLDWKALPDPPTGVVEDKLISSTIVTSMWIGGLAETWAEIETLRLGRQHLRKVDPKEVDLPLATSAARPQ